MRPYSPGPGDFQNGSRGRTLAELLTAGSRPSLLLAGLGAYLKSASLLANIVATASVPALNL